MAIENAKRFVEMVAADAALKARIETLDSEAVLAAAKEMGLDFTAEELKAAAMVQEVALDELDKVVGGVGKKMSGKMSGGVAWCTKSPNQEHNWVKTGHEEEPHSFLCWDWTYGYDHYKCTYCGKTKREHV